ncbi:MAG: hypothetical protein KGJ23_15210 [Euryarchaeota archaeon]|nr:hypothetical protein [Euryarchaeota archaeon]MDE1837949.1 hypothetical protein [Euryarchaeota archaeon]MDE2046640.1 hypothetical protein [Thermoplasmata archaeon]
MNGPTVPVPGRGGAPSLLPGILRVVQATHQGATERVSKIRDEDGGGGDAEVLQEEHRIPEVRPDELDGSEWLPALFWHRPEEEAFPGQYAVVAQPFTAGPTQTGLRDHQDRPLTYLVLFVMGAVAPGAPLPPELLRDAFHDTMIRATRLAKGLSEEMNNATVRLLLVRMPEWMARKLLPSLKGVRPV